MRPGLLRCVINALAAEAIAIAFIVTVAHAIAAR